VAIARNRQRIMGNIDVCVDSESLEIKVPMVCLVTEGVSPPKDGHYSIMYENSLKFYSATFEPSE
jgi:hypothetical protein